jgi:hypothetical protein
MNVNRCAGFKKHGLHCAFLIMPKDENGKPQEDSAKCALHCSPVDDYRLYPEHDSATGKVIHNRTDWTMPEPWRVGPNVLYESLSPHETGMTYSFRSSKCRIPEDDFMHPSYSLQNVNEPFLDSIGDNTIITPFGEGANLSLSTIGWKEQEVRGIESVSKCYHAIYGYYNALTQMVEPRCIREHIGDIPGWINYTNVPPRKKVNYTFFLEYANKEQIVDWAIKWFGTTTVAVRIAEIMLYVKTSREYINIRDALINNGIKIRVVKAFLMNTNMNIKKADKLNIHTYFMYYKFLKSLKRPESFIWRANLINFLMNNERLSNMNPNKPDGVNKAGDSIFNTGTRYWWFLMIMKDVIATDDVSKVKLLNRTIIPEWVFNMIDEYLKPKSLPPIEKKVPVIKLEEILSDIKGHQISFPTKLFVFAPIIHAGKRWTKMEIRATWYNFLQAFDGKCPNKFWNWVNDVRTADPLQVSTLMEIKIKTSDGIILEKVDEPPQRAFIQHLLEAMTSENSFHVKVPSVYESWLTIPRTGSLEKDDSPRDSDPREIFWKALKATHTKMGKTTIENFEHLKAMLIKQRPQEASQIIADCNEELSDTIILGDAIDEHGDIFTHNQGIINIVNIDGGTAHLSSTSDTEGINDAEIDEPELDIIEQDIEHIDEQIKNDNEES